MSAWRRRREARRAAKARRAQDRLHGRGAVARSRRGSDWGESAGEVVVDILLALPRGFLWLLSKIVD